MLPASNFRRDPAGHLGNQCGHICIGLAAYVLLGVWGGAGAVLIGAAYFVGWECGVQRLRLFWDSIEDTNYVTVGALFVPSMKMGYGPGMVIVVGLALAFGAWLRQ